MVVSIDGIAVTKDDVKDPSKNFTRFMDQCFTLRFTCLSTFVIATFIICITQEFTFILNFRGYIKTTLQGPLLSKILLSSSPEKLHQVKSPSQQPDDWRKIMEDIYVYSAYWDTRFTNNSFVRIIGAASDIETKINFLKCLFKFHESESIYHEVPVSYDIIIEHHNKLFKIIYLKCIPEIELSPQFVSIVPQAQNVTTTSLKWIQVHAIKSEIQPKRIGVCVRPLFNYTDVFRIAEFIAYYEALGVEHFAFYNYDSSNEVQRMISLAQISNYSIEWLPWNLPIHHTDIWALGQLGSINDCFYRYMPILSHIIVVDLDEFITPRKVNNVQELLSTQDISEKHISSFVIRSTVFCLEYDQDTFERYIPPFITQISTRREKYVYPFLVRTKYIAKPHMVVAAGVHQVWEFLSGYEERFVPASHVMVHHYRANLCIGERQQYLDAGIIDITSRKYLSSLLKSKIFGLWEKNFSLRKLCS